MKKSFYSILLLCLALVFFCSPAFAATTAAYSEANLNLDEFATKFNLFTTGPFTWSGYATSTYAEAQSPPAVADYNGFGHHIKHGIADQCGSALLRKGRCRTVLHTDAEINV